MRPTKKHKIGHFILIFVALLLRLVSYIRLLMINSSHKKEDKRILIIDPYGLGDVFSLQPLIKQLYCCGYEVIVAAKHKWRSLIPDEYITEWVDCELPWSDYDPKNKYSLKNIANKKFQRSLKSLIRISPGSIGVDTRGDIRSVLLLYFSGCRTVYSLSQRLSLNIKIPRITAKIVPRNREMRRWTQNMEFAKAIGCNVGESHPPSLKHLISDCEKLHELRTKNLLGIIPVAPWEGRQWPSSYWKRFLNEMRHEEIEMMALCGPNEKIKAERLTNNIIPVRELQSISEWAKELSKCSIVVTIDSGPMHMSDALGLKLVVIVGPSNLPLWSPNTENARILHHQKYYDCAPCLQVVSFEHCGYRCIRSVKPIEVLNAFMEIKE